MSTHAQVLRLRRVRRCLAINGSDDIALSLSGQDRHTEVVPLVPVEHRKQNTGTQRLACVTLRTDAQDKPVTRSALR